MLESMNENPMIYYFSRGNEESKMFQGVKQYLPSKYLTLLLLLFLTPFMVLLVIGFGASLSDMSSTFLADSKEVDPSLMGTLTHSLWSLVGLLGSALYYGGGLIVFSSLCASLLYWVQSVMSVPYNLIRKTNYRNFIQGLIVTRFTEKELVFGRFATIVPDVWKKALGFFVLLFSWGLAYHELYEGQFFTTTAMKNSFWFSAGITALWLFLIAIGFVVSILMSSFNNDSYPLYLGSYIGLTSLYAVGLGLIVQDSSQLLPQSLAYSALGFGVLIILASYQEAYKAIYNQEAVEHYTVRSERPVVKDIDNAMAYLFAHQMFWGNSRAQILFLWSCIFFVAGVWNDTLAFWLIIGAGVAIMIRSARLKVEGLYNKKVLPWLALSNISGKDFTKALTKSLFLEQLVWVGVPLLLIGLKSSITASLSDFAWAPFALIVSIQLGYFLLAANLSYSVAAEMRLSPFHFGMTAVLSSFFRFAFSCMLVFIVLGIVFWSTKSGFATALVLLPALWGLYQVLVNLTANELRYAHVDC